MEGKTVTVPEMVTLDPWIPDWWPSADIASLRWRPDHDGGDEDASASGSEFDTLRRVDSIGDFDWWINHPHSPRNIRPVMLLGVAVEWT